VLDAAAASMTPGQLLRFTVSPVEPPLTEPRRGEFHQYIKPV